MMKKIVCLLLALLSVAVLAGCGEKKEPAAEVDLQAVYDAAAAAIDSGDVVLFQEQDPQMINSVYEGLGDITCRQMVIALPPVLGAACEVAMVETTTAADAEAVRAIFQARIDSMANDTAYPDNAKGWKNGAHLTVNGNFVVLAVMPEGVELPAAFLGEF